MKAYVHLWYLAQFFLGWEMFQTNVVEEIKTQIFRSITFSKSRASRAVPSWLCLEGVIKPARNLPVPIVQQKTPDDGQRRCPKHAEFYNRINLNN